MKSSRRPHAAFTLIEMLVAGGAASAILGALLVASVALQRSFSASSRMAAAQSDLARVTDYMSKDIRNATSVTSASSSTVPLTVTTAEYTASTTPALSRTGAIYGSTSVTIRYVRSGPRVLREVSRGTSVTSTWIADYVDDLAVSADAAGTVTITATSAMCYGRRPTGAKVPASSLMVTAFPRNSTL